MHPDVEREARAERVLLEDHRQPLVAKHFGVDLASGLELAGAGAAVLEPADEPGRETHAQAPVQLKIHSINMRETEQGLFRLSEWLKQIEKH